MNRRTWLAGVGASLLALRLRDGRGGLRAATAPLTVGIGLQWQSERIADALETRPSPLRHTLANVAVDKLAITAALGDQTIQIPRDATPLVYDPARRLYLTSSLDRADVERLSAAAATARFTVDLRFTYFTFFDVLLAQLTRTDRTLNNLANPTDADAIARTFEQKLRADKLDIAYQAETHSIHGVPCTCVAMHADPGAAQPAVELRFEIDFLGAITASRRASMRKLVAMDWSALVGVDEKTGPLPADLDVWRENVLRYLANQTDMRRAERFRTTIAARHATKRPRELADDVREDIDLHLVSANRWGTTREDPDREPHQALLSDLFETQYGNPASVTRMSRELVRRYALDLDAEAALTLQYGTGYCGEHARVAFSILRTIMAMPRNHVDSIVLCGNANIDHAFVLVNLQVTRVLLTTATNDANTRVGVGDDIRVFDLREALAANGDREVFVVDPYLDREMSSRTGERLLLALNSQGKQNRGKDTDFLKFEDQHPMPGSFTTVDIRERSAAVRRRLVKNV